MSKSLSQIWLPALGGTALVVAGGVAVINNDYGQSRIERLENRVSEISSHADRLNAQAKAESEKATALKSQIAELNEKANQSTSVGQSEPAPKIKGKFSLGRPALKEEITAWDIDVLPDGRGLPKGSGDALTGEEVFAENCASCHGDFAEGVDNWPVLAGGFDTLADEDPVKTVGSYWPYLSTVWDYINRSMPFGNAQSLTADEVYAITAYILYSNDLVNEDFVLSDKNFSEFAMHNKDGFVVDDRPETEYAAWSAEPCMKDCKQSVEITMRASVLNVTPEEEGAASMEDHGAKPQQASMASTTTDAPKTEVVPASAPDLDQALVAKGEKVFRKCGSCHQVGKGAKNKSGPKLNGIFGQNFASVDGFKYSEAFLAAKDEGRSWSAEELDAFLTKPKAHIKGTKMAFSGLKKADDRTALIEFLKSAGE